MLDGGDVVVEQVQYFEVGYLEHWGINGNNIGIHELQMRIVLI